MSEDNESPISSMPKPSFWPIAALLALTLIWLITITYLTMNLLKCPNFNCIWRLEPNELGDFLAGAFAPLAFVWLAGAVFIQSQELAEQRRELHFTNQEVAAQTKILTRNADILLANEHLDVWKVLIEQLENATLRRFCLMYISSSADTIDVRGRVDVEYFSKSYARNDPIGEIIRAEKKLREFITEFEEKDTCFYTYKNDWESFAEIQGLLSSLEKFHSKTPKATQINTPQTKLVAANKSCNKILDMLVAITITEDN